jgi:hypothetical protein
MEEFGHMALRMIKGPLLGEREDQIQIKGQIIAIDARGTQKAIGEKIWGKGAD